MHFAQILFQPKQSVHLFSWPTKTSYVFVTPKRFYSLFFSSGFIHFNFRCIFNECNAHNRNLYKILFFSLVLSLFLLLQVWRILWDFRLLFHHINILLHVNSPYSHFHCYCYLLLFLFWNEQLSTTHTQHIQFDTRKKSTSKAIGDFLTSNSFAMCIFGNSLLLRLLAEKRVELSGLCFPNFTLNWTHCIIQLNSLSFCKLRAIIWNIFSKHTNMFEIIFEFVKRLL